MALVMVDGTAIHTDNKLREGKRIHGRGTITRTFNHPSEYVYPNKAMCDGCEDNFYNGNNPYNVKECWAYKTAVVVNKVGYSSIHVPNGPDTIMKKTLSCWHAVSK